MYSLINKLFHVVGLYHFDTNVYLKKENTLYDLEKKHKDIVLFEASDIFLTKEYVIFNTTEGSKIYYNENNIIKGLPNLIGLNIYTNKGDSWIFTDFTYKKLWYVNLTNLNQTLLTSEYNWEFLTLVNSNLFINNKENLKSLSLLTGEYEWEVDLSEYGEIRSVLAAVQDNLWVLANDYKNNHHSLLRLDANSGRVMQVLGEGLKLSDAHVKYIEEKQTLLSFKSSISSVPSPSTLIEIDAKTGEILRNVTVESMLEPNLKVGLWQYQDNQLFFTANTTMMTTTHIGVLDYNTLELLWSTEVLDRKGLLKDIQVSSDKIYVLDQVGTLHIFENEID